MHTISKFSSVILYVTLGITILISGMFFFGGQVDPDVENPEPVYTQALLNWMYCLLILSSLALLVFSGIKFIRIFKENPRTFWRNFFVFTGMVVLLVIAWISGSGKTLNIEGYDGKENTFFWLKLTDMLLYAIYMLAGLTIAAMLAANIKDFFRK